MSTTSEPNPKLQQRAQAYFHTGTDAALKSNFDYAIDMFREALKIAPDNLLYRQALRGVERRKFGNEPSKVGKLVGARTQPLRLGARTAKARGKWIDVLETCEDIFKHNPWDVGAAEDAADAAEHLGFYPVAKWLMESVRPQAGDDVGFIRHAARVYELTQDWEQAINCWELVKRLSPNDEDAIRKTRSLSASATIARSGLSEAIHNRPDGHSGPEVVKPEVEEMHAVKMTAEERLLKIIEENPQRVGTYLELADLHRRLNKLDEAERVLARGLKEVPGDEVLVSAHAEIQIARLHRYIEVWGKKAKEDPTNADAAGKLAKGQQMLNDYEVKELRRRIGLHPEDLKLRYELGLILARIGKCDEAIAEFQQARALPALKVQALHQAGICFESKHLPKLAERNYEEALKLVDPGDTTTVNSLHYHLGRVAESQGDLRKAEEHYNEVAANDYTYMDVAERLRSLNHRA